MSDNKPSSPTVAGRGVAASSPAREKASRRDLVATLLGVAAGGAALHALSGCSQGVGESEDDEDGDDEDLGEAVQAATGTALRWADSVLGAAPPATRTGDLATKNSSAIGNAVVVIAKGCVTAGDGGGGIFYWEAGVTTGDNGGTIIVPSPSPTGRWIRIYSGPLNVKWFGARGDGTSDTGAIQAALNALAALALATNPLPAGELYFPAGYYNVNTNFSLVSLKNIKIAGAGRGATTIFDSRPQGPGMLGPVGPYGYGSLA